MKCIEDIQVMDTEDECKNILSWKPEQLFVYRFLQPKAYLDNLNMPDNSYEPKKQVFRTLGIEEISASISSHIIFIKVDDILYPTIAYNIQFTLTTCYGSIYITLDHDFEDIIIQEYNVRYWKRAQANDIASKGYQDAKRYLKKYIEHTLKKDPHKFFYEMIRLAVENPKNKINDHFDFALTTENSNFLKYVDYE